MQSAPGTCENWQTISTEVQFSHAHVAVAAERVRTPRGVERDWIVVKRKLAVVIAPFTHDGKIILIRQERVPIRASIWEMPAGQVDDVDADAMAIEAVARRELREETGYELAAEGELISFGLYFTSPGLTDECCHLFLARPVERCGGTMESDEESAGILECREFTIEEIVRMIRDNEIRDANTLGICARLAAHGIISLSA